METKFTTCKNGHNYNASMGQCPYCPNENSIKTFWASPATADKTQLDNNNTPRPVDKTMIDTAAPTLQASRADKTVIMGGAESSPSAPPPASRRLVGWFVTYDINASGTDYRLYEGRTKIGNSSKSDIVLNHKGISEDHALLLYRDQKFVIQDMLSTNGTIVNGESVEDRRVLIDNDIVKIGQISLKLKII